MKKLEAKKHRRGLDIIVYGYNELQIIPSDPDNQLIKDARPNAIVCWEVPNIKGLSDYLNDNEAEFEEFCQNINSMISPKTMFKSICKRFYDINKKAKKMFLIGGFFKGNPIGDYTVTYNFLNDVILGGDLSNEKIDVYVGEPHRIFLTKILEKLNFKVEGIPCTSFQVPYNALWASTLKGMGRLTVKNMAKRLKKKISEDDYLNSDKLNSHYLQTNF